MALFLKFSVCMLILLSGSHLSHGNKIRKEELIQGILIMADEMINASISRLQTCGNQENESINSDGNDLAYTLRYLQIGQRYIRESQAFFPLCDKSERYDKPSDCSEVLKNGNTESGLYSIWPKSRLSSGASLTVYCDMETDGGGWTVIQRRGNFSCQEDFYQNWDQYKSGFGNKEMEFWLGNDNIHALTNQAEYEVRFDLEDSNGEQGFAKYREFWIDGEDSRYQLHIGNYTGNVGDCMKHHNNMRFSTKDRGSTQYSKFHKGGWWYSNWAHSNLNGRITTAKNSVESVHWWYWRQNRGLASVEIKVRPS